MDFKVDILMTEFVTHDVKRFITSKPQNPPPADKIRGADSLPTGF